VNGERGLWPESLMAGLATLAVAWPLTELLRETSWIPGAVLMVLVVATVGAGLRTIGVGPTLVVLTQLVTCALGLCWIYLAETLWYLLPTGATLTGAAELLQEAGTVLQTYAAPAPAPEGVQFLVVGVLTLTALSVDSIGVTGRAPATAGIPLAAAFLVSISNNGQAMEPYYFVAVAVAWLAMVAQQGDRVVSGWSSADRRETVGSRDVSFGPTGHRTLARVLGAVTVVGALLIASLLPHLPPTFFGQGLARNPEARNLGEGSGQVSFTETMDLAQDLSNRSQAPVIRYRTDSTFLEPLRVTATRDFEDGQWQPPDYDEASEPRSGPFTSQPEQALAAGVQTDQAEIVVTQSSLSQPHLAVPAPTIRVDLEVPWRLDDGTDALRVLDPVPRYAATYLQVAPRGQLPDGIGGPVGGAVPEDYLAVDPEGREAIEELADQVVGDAENDVEVAVLLQDHLRSGQYRYSLTLEPGLGQTDPITHFLVTRQGYCVQFATAMVMMARSEGIPARMAVGFLSGELQADGSRVVLASDAHTWPELFIDGLGWTRFEPTPGTRTGPAPAYTQLDLGQAEPDPTAGQTQPEEITPTVPTGGVADEDNSLWGSLVGLAPGLGRALLLGLVLAALMAVIPWAGRRYREGELRSASTPGERIEGQWLLMTRSLEDLGVQSPEPRSPREMRHHYHEHTKLDRRSGEALTRVTATLERSRYAPSQAQDDKQAAAMGRDVRAVVDAVQERLPWNIRTNSKVLPRSGLHYLRERLTGLFRR